MSNLVEEAEERLKKLLSLTEKTVGKERGMRGDNPKLDLGVVTTGIPGLDVVLGNGGFKRGSMTLIEGQASMGKTLLTQLIIRAFQEQGLLVGFIDPEKTYSADWFEATGVDTKSLIVARPTTTEQAFDLAISWAEAKMDLIVIDSLAALVPSYRVTHTLEDKEVIGKAAMMLNVGISKLNTQNLNSVILYTNQYRHKQS